MISALLLLAILVAAAYFVTRNSDDDGPGPSGMTGSGRLLWGAG